MARLLRDSNGQGDRAPVQLDGALIQVIQDALLLGSVPKGVGKVAEAHGSIRMGPLLQSHSTLLYVVRHVIVAKDTELKEDCE